MAVGIRRWVCAADERLHTLGDHTERRLFRPSQRIVDNRTTKTEIRERYKYLVNRMNQSDAKY